MNDADQGSNGPRQGLIFGTRRSELALWQTRFVAGQIQSQFPLVSISERHVQTMGDLQLDKPLPEIGGKGLFTEELDRQLLAGEIDCAVHSLKDLPTKLPAGLRLGAILNREDPRDAWVCPNGFALTNLPPGSRVGTSSLRRQAQLLSTRPDLQVLSIRGNVPTRIEKVKRGEYDAIVIAAAGVIRLGLTEVVTQWLSLDEMLPAPGQGALAVACRDADTFVGELLSAIHEPHVARCTAAERRLLSALGGGCSAPIAALATGVTFPEGEPSTAPTPSTFNSCSASSGESIHLTARVLSPDGTSVVAAADQGRDPEGLGDRVAQLLLDRGAGEILNKWHTQWRGASLAKGRLCGRKIAVTRALSDAESLAVLLRAEGAEPVLLPVLDYIPLPNPDLETQLRQLAANDWLVLTSATGLRFLQQAVRDLCPLVRQFRVACVGSATAEAAARLGLQVAFVPKKFTGRDLALSLPLGDEPGTVVWIRPQEADGRVSEILTARGATVCEVCLYATLPRNLDQQQRQTLLSGIDAVTFASSSAVQYFFEQLDEAELATVSQLPIACIGTVTAACLQAHGWGAGVVPAEHTLPAMVQALADYFDSPTKKAAQ